MAGIDSKIKGVNTSPTEAQKEAGNYKKAHISVHGFKITIENPKGSKRYYDGGKKFTVMKNHYGYFNGATGHDGDQVDVFLGNDLDSDRIFVVDQKKTDGSFDESKVMLGFKTEKEAKDAYLSNYSPGWKGFMAITGIEVEKFKDWLYSGRKQGKPFSEYKRLKENRMNKTVKLTESDIHNIIKNCVKRALNERRALKEDHDVVERMKSFMKESVDEWGEDAADMMGMYDGPHDGPTNEPCDLDKMYDMVMRKIRRTGDFEDDLNLLSNTVMDVMDKFYDENAFNGLDFDKCVSLVARSAIKKIDPIYYREEIEDDELFEAVNRVFNRTFKPIKENKLTRNDDYTYPEKVDDAEMDRKYNEWMSGQRAEAYGGAPENDEPDLWQDQADSGLLIDADDAGEGFSADYHRGEEYAKNLLAKSKDITGLVEELNRKEDDGSITAFELGMLDTLDEG